MRFSVVILFALLLSLAGCSTLMFDFFKQFSDGEQCLRVTDGEEIIEVCITKDTFEVEYPAEDTFPEAVTSPRLDPLVLLYNRAGDPEAPAPVEVVNGAGAAERLVSNVGFPIAVCFILIYIGIKFLRTIDTKLDKVITLLESRKG